MNKYSDKAIRSKNLKDMNEAEKALTLMEVERAAEVLKSKYRGEKATMRALSHLLEKEVSRLEEEERLLERQKAPPVRFGESNLFDEGDNH
jgi:hypothetical protein